MSSDRGQSQLSVPHGFEDDARSRLLRARPPVSALEWVGTRVGGAVTRVRALRGGRSSAIHALRVSPVDGEPRWVVLRRYVLPHILAEEPDLVEREAGVLKLLRGRGLNVPRLLAVDATGAGAGAPAVLMSLVSGRLDWSPADADVWLRGLAGFLVGLHAVPLPARHGLAAFTPYPPERWEPPGWMRQKALWHRALRIFHSPPVDVSQTLIHRDYHPGNVLWRAGEVSGVVDWQSGCVGPPSVDVAWCRLNILGGWGIEAADRLVSYWEDASGQTYHPWPEVVLLVDRMSWPSVPKLQERVDLEVTLARRLAELHG